MKPLIMGPPGAGKGTQAKILAQKFNLVHLSTGDILRKEIDKASKTGLKAQTYMNAGNLVPDEVLLAMMNSTLTELKDHGVILDGFPRTIPQAMGLSKIPDSIINAASITNKVCEVFLSLILSKIKSLITG